MALDDTEDEPTPQPAASLSPALQDFQNAFTHPEAQGWANEATTRLNDYFQKRQLADDNAAIGQSFVNDIDQFKSGLIKMVTADPHAVHTALDLVPPTIGGIIGNMPGAPEDAEDHHNAITSHIQSEVAAQAITTAAYIHADMARGILDSPRIKDVLGDDAHAALSTYTNMQETARQRDTETRAAQDAQAQQVLADRSTGNYISALTGAKGEFYSPPNWNQAVMADNKVPPQDKVDLFNIHEQLRQNGDAATDPHAVMDLVNRAANGQLAQRDLYPHIGATVSLADIGTLTSALKQPHFMQQLNDTIQSARQQIAPDGDIAGTRALGRYVSWMMPQLRQGATVDPAYEDWIGHAAIGFPINGDDLIARPVPANRPSLGQIFAEGKPPMKDYMSDYERAQSGRGAPAPMMPTNPATGSPMTPRDMMDEAARRGNA